MDDTTQFTLIINTIIFICKDIVNQLILDLVCYNRHLKIFFSEFNINNFYGILFDLLNF